MSEGGFVSRGRVPSLLGGKVVTARSHHFCRRNTVSPVNIAETTIAGCFTKHALRNNDAVARRAMGGVFLSGSQAVLHGVRRLTLTIRLRGCCAGSRVLRLCLGAVCFNRNTCKLGRTDLACFNGRPGSLSLSRYTVLTKLPRTPDTCSPVSRPGRKTRHVAIILALVTRRKCVSPRSTTGTTVGL